jgi:pimeloyl-ACP methyl ester carboxylesterase
VPAPELKKITLENERVISYRESGSGTPLVILHGLGGRSESWVPQYQGLGADYRVIGWDAPGYGESSEIELDQPNIEDYAEVFIRFIDALGIERCHLMGHSVGTCIAAKVHQDHADRLLSLTLAEAVIGNGSSSEEEKNRMLQSRADDLEEMGPSVFAEKRTPNSLSPSADPDAIRAAVDFAKGMQVSGYLKLFGALVRANMFEYVDALRVPAMIVAGSDDKSAPEEFVRQIAAAFSGIRYEVIAGIGHQIAFEKPEIFVDLLRHHIKAAEAALSAG